MEILMGRPFSMNCEKMPVGAGRRDADGWKPGALLFIPKGIIIRADSGEKAGFRPLLSMKGRIGI